MQPAATRAHPWVLPVISAVLITVFVYAVFIGGTHPGVSETGPRMMSGALALAILIGWAILAIFRPAWRPKSVMLLPIVLAFLIFCVSALFSQVPRLSQDAILQAGGLVLAFLLLSELAGDLFYRKRLIGIVVGVTLVIVIAYAAHVLISWLIWWSSVGRLTAPPLRPSPSSTGLVSPILATALTWLNLGAVNLMAGICLLAMPFVVAVAAGRSRAMALFLAGLGVFVLVASASRGALLGVVFAGITAIALVFVAVGIDSGSPLRIKRFASPRQIAAAVFAGAITLALFVVVFAQTIVSRFAGGIDSARLSIYGATINLIEAHPLLGSGPGTWSLLHSAVTPEGERNIVQNHAHDTYLQTLSDVGILGALACLGVAVIVVWTLFARFRAADSAQRLVLGGILVGLAGAAGHAISDHFLNLAGYCLILAALVAIGVESPKAEATPMPSGDVSRSSRWTGLGVLAAAIVAVLLISPTVLAHARAELLAADARVAADRGDWPAAADSVRRATELDPGLPLYRMELGLALAHLGDPGARAIIAQASAEDPLPHNQLSVAALALADGDTRSALDAVELATARSSGEVIIELYAGEVARISGHPDLAVEWWSEAMADNVELAGSNFFREPSRIQLRGMAIGHTDARMAAAGDEISRATLKAYAGAPDDAVVALEAIPASTPRDVALARVLWVLNRQSDAIELLKSTAEADPLAPEPSLALVEYCTAVGDDTCRDRYVRRALITEGEVNTSTKNEGSTIPAPPDQRWRGVPDAYPESVYLQDGFEDMLAPNVLVVGTP